MHTLISLELWILIRSSRILPQAYLRFFPYHCPPFFLLHLKDETIQSLTHQYTCRRRRCANYFALQHPMVILMGECRTSNQLILVNPPCPPLSKESSLCPVLSIREAILTMPSEKLLTQHLSLLKSSDTNASFVMLRLPHHKHIMVT